MVEEPFRQVQQAQRLPLILQDAEAVPVLAGYSPLRGCSQLAGQCRQTLLSIGRLIGDLSEIAQKREARGRARSL